jgi:hypothetical protein
VAFLAALPAAVFNVALRLLADFFLLALLALFGDFFDLLFDRVDERLLVFFADFFFAMLLLLAL